MIFHRTCFRFSPLLMSADHQILSRSSQFEDSAIVQPSSSHCVCMLRTILATIFFKNQSTGMHSKSSSVVRTHERTHKQNKLLLFVKFRLFLLLLGKPQSTIFTHPYGSWSFQGNVFDGMSQGTTTAITDCHFLFDFDDRDLAHQLIGIGSHFPQFVLYHDGSVVILKL